MNDSITKLDVDILNKQSEEISGSELGALKYVSELLDWDVKRTANLFILILIFVFDPLAITLVIATNQAFKGKRKDELTPQVTIHDTIHDEVEIPESYLTYVNTQVEPEIIEEETKTYWQKEADRVWETVRKLKEEGVFPEQTEEEKLDEPTSLAFTPYYEEEEIVHDEVEVTDQVPTDYRPSTDQVEDEEKYKLKPTKEWLEQLQKILDENYKIPENNSDEPIKPTEEELIKLENLLFEKENKEVEEEKKEEILVDNLPSQEPKSKKLTYLNRDGYGKSLRINRI
jgi:hypothetical protein